MYHLYPSSKGDPICPLGFHPQTRWPTRCKRCFRDYKEHGGRRGSDDIASSSPNLSDGLNTKSSSRSWTSTQNLSSTNGSSNSNDIELKKRPQSWTSTPALDDTDRYSRDNLKRGEPTVENNVDVTLKLPPRRHSKLLESRENEDSIKQKQSSSITTSTASSSSKDVPKDLVIHYSDNLGERMRKMTLLKKQRSTSRERSFGEEYSTSDTDNSKTESSKSNEQKRPATKKNSTSTSTSTSTLTSMTKPSSGKSSSEQKSDRIKTTQDVEFMLKVKDNNSLKNRNKQSDSSSLTTETTDTTIVGVGDRELQEEVKSLREELENMRSRAERAERDKSDILLRRLASMELAPNRTAASEALMLQQKVNVLNAQLEQVNEEKRKLNNRMKDLQNLPKSADHDLKRKLQAAESLCEELMEENQKAKKELRSLKDEMEEMHDSFRDNQAEVNTTLQKQLESATKNCRILSFKLKKCERKIESLEHENQPKYNDEIMMKMKKMEEELKFSNELARKLQIEADELRNPGKKKPPTLGIIGKSTSADGKFTRESLTRGGSQEDPQQLLRDLEDSMERESDLKDQLKFAEEESRRLRRRRNIPIRITIGTQTLDVEVLSFPRSTQTNYTIDSSNLPLSLRNGSHNHNVTENCHKSDNSDNSIQEVYKLIDAETMTETEVNNFSTSSTQTDICNNNNNDNKKFSFDIFSTIREISFFNNYFPITTTNGQRGLLFPRVISRGLISADAGRKLSPTFHRLTSEVPSDHDEGISDEDDPAELRILLELNEQEASILRVKVEELEKDKKELKRQFNELQEKLRNENSGSKKLQSLLPFNSNTTSSEKKLKALNDDLTQLRKTIVEKDRVIEQLQTDKSKTASSSDKTIIEMKRKLDLVEQEAITLRSKITNVELENEKLVKDNKKMLLQVQKRNSIGSERNDSLIEITKLKETLANVEHERNEINSKYKRVVQEAIDKLPTRTPKRITDLTPKNHLKKWVEELEEEITEMRVIVINCGTEKFNQLEIEKKLLERNLQETKEELHIAEEDLKKLKVSSNSNLEQKLKKIEDEKKKLNSKVKELEDKVKKQDNQINHSEAAKSLLELQAKREKEKLLSLEKEYEKEHKEREKWEIKVSQLDDELSLIRKSSEKTKTLLEKEIKELKSKVSDSKSSSTSTKQIQELRKQLLDVQASLEHEKGRYNDLNILWEKLSEETILMRAQLTTEKQNLQTELNTYKQKVSNIESMQNENQDLAKRLKEAQKKIHDLESKQLKSESLEYERAMLKNKLKERDQEYDRLRRENEMNIDLVFQLRKDNDELNRKLNDFSRIDQVQQSMNGHSVRLENEIKSMKLKLENAELNSKAEVASTRLRYEQQVKNLSAELTGMHRQCERFKKDRDTFKQLLESAQKKISDLKGNTTGRHSRASMHSSDDDDKSKIAYLVQQIGCLEDQLCESRLEVSKVKTELVSERSANEIKISEMRSKLNEFEEDRVIGSGRTKIPGMKTKLELSWQKEREDQQRLLQETSTLARDLRQTLFEVERERDKERLESKRRIDQLKRETEEEMEEGRRKISELQCDLLELRDVHAKLRTSNEKLRRERERYEKELIKRRVEHDGGERRIGTLLQAVDELVRIAPELRITSSDVTTTSAGNSLRSEESIAKRSSSPSPKLNSSQISNAIAHLFDASEDLRKFQRISEDENERIRIRRGNLRRAASQENDPTNSVPPQPTVRVGNSNKLVRGSAQNGALVRKSLSLDHSIQQDQNIWRQDEGSLSSMQSIDSELGGMVRDSNLDSRIDSRLSGGSTQSDIPRGPRKKKKSLIGKLRSLTKSSRNSESEISMQGSDSDISVASDMRASRKDLRGRLSGMFRRSDSASRSVSNDRSAASALQNRPVAVTIVGDEDGTITRDPPATYLTTPKPIRSIAKPPTPTTPLTRRRVEK